jgi:hypothetical protein
MPAVHSFLPHGPNVVAQALLGTPALRGVQADQLARTLHVSGGDARQGIAAIIGMINRSAQPGGDSALQPEPSLSIAIGPFMSLDSAMSRFGAHMGPIVRSPTPSPLFRPDAGPDRQFGAGRTSHGPRSGRGGGSNTGYDYGEAGAVSSELDAAATQMLAFLSENGCNVAPAGVVGNFQIAYNAAGYSPALATDDKYGPLTRTAAMQVIHDADVSTELANMNAPAACSYAPVPATPSAPVRPVLPTSTPIAQASMFDSPWTWATLAVLAGATMIARSKHPPKWARKIGLHR